jgi:Na+-translocating ferredoxin:NAD+ oxidoreductase RnfG subunit
MDIGVEASKNLTAIGIVLSFLCVVSTMLLSIVAYFLKSFVNDVKSTRDRVDDHDVILENHKGRIETLEEKKRTRRNAFT